MSNHSCSLKEFIDPLPICQPDTDLGNILSIFQHSNCKMLAISQGKLGWGIINSEDLLSLVAEVWLGGRLRVTSHPRNYMHQQNKSYRLIPEVKTLIKPAMVYQADTKLNEFLGYLKYSCLLTQEQVCLIVNQQGELQGRLNKDKIIEYLASASWAVEDRQLSPSLDYLTTLLEAIALPSKIETPEGQVIYTNRLWQRLMIENQSASSEVELNEMTQWLIDRQEDSVAADPQNSRSSSIRLDVSEELESDQDSLNIEITQISSWNYLNIPLISDRPKQLLKENTAARGATSPLGQITSFPQELTGASGETDPQDSHQQTATEKSHNLVLATPKIKFASTANDSTSTPEISVYQLLANVSHELKSPLTGIIGLIGLLQGEKLGNLNQRQARYAELIYRSGKKMIGVVDDLLQLTALITDQPRDLELIDLESLCRQLHQEVLTKVHSMQARLNSAVDLPQLKLSIELGSEIAIPKGTRSVIANKLLLSSVLSHLMLEAVDGSATIKPLKIQVKSLSKLTAVMITGEAISTTANPGLNLMIAKCLSKPLEAKVTHACSTTSCQFTLLLPKKKIQLSDESAANSTTNLTILCLYPDLEVIDSQASQSCSSNFNLKSWSDNYVEQTGYQHRIIEADSLEQAHNLARIWQLDAIILNGYQIAQPSLYLRSLQKSEHLANLPLITLDTKTTEAANQIKGLNVYPCLISAQQCNVDDLIQVIQIASKSR
ncbi:hypothetical protein C7B62_03060 [Pleurocapsa sp. CCALA 161]|uniref:hybrid sensor histidine kinase/response regulator n=1 Tax=Pleurocapsa sp. CCALA 161 TaxID=2107688 RepID=UPI000D05816A|nr:histidine kinase dimerization/phospho-acceptor domain-containing protein [Pleurocapsa sp. CCALA 161]PSB12049.1 hypothetical protein C7B62_03060 [Pleurocapsa sp. CCALA 161]